ncbi:MAG TPA: DUF2628 domain-containing protein [Burkholderiaceae bacterium]
MNGTNPYASPVIDAFEARYKQEGADVERLAVAKKWKQRFHVVKGAGGIAAAGHGATGFNALAFIFGSIYYLTKGMWRKAFSLLGLTIAINIACGIALLLMNLPDKLGYLASIAIAGMYGLRANADYYKKMVLGDNGWW